MKTQLPILDQVWGKTPHTRLLLLAAINPFVGIQGLVWRGWLVVARVDRARQRIHIKGFFNLN